MVDDGIKNGIHKVAECITLKYLKLFKSFLYRNFRKYECDGKMLTKSNQPGQLYGIARKHAFTNVDWIPLVNLKLLSVIAQTGTYSYNLASFG